VSAVLAETLGSIAAALRSMPEKVPLGVELSCSHHRAATEGEVTGVCTPLHRSRTVATFEIRVSDDQQRPICTGRLTCLLRDLRPEGAVIIDCVPAATEIVVAGTQRVITLR
jgi:uncharacterized protein (TIGR00369 family)